jgi:hypothetical protein
MKQINGGKPHMTEHTQYRITWIADKEVSQARSHPPVNGPVHVGQATEHANTMAQAGWELIQVVPGTNAQTYGGLYLTFRRALE